MPRNPSTEFAGADSEPKTRNLEPLRKSRVTLQRFNILTLQQFLNRPAQIVQTSAASSRAYLVSAFLVLMSCSIFSRRAFKSAISASFSASFWFNPLIAASSTPSNSSVLMPLSSRPG